MAEIVCPSCETPFHDQSGQLGSIRRLVQEGHLTLMLGCGRCGLLYFPELAALGAKPAAKPAPSMAETVAMPTEDAPRQAEPSTTEPGARYSFYRELGRGGMGVVYWAYDQEAKQEVCVKRLNPRVDRRSLRQEWSATSRLEHPNLVRTLDLFEAKGALHMVMEYVHGEPLSAWLTRHGPMHEALVIEIGRQLFAAMAYAHEQGVIHRDIKPHNIMLAWDGDTPKVKILDFGLAIIDTVDHQGAVTGAGNVAGTPFYMAPEQIRGEQLDAACDVHAAGLTLIHLLLGRVPYQAESIYALMQEKVAAREGVSVPPGSSSVELRALLALCTHPSRETRPSAAHALEQLSYMLPPLDPPAVIAPMNAALSRPASDSFPIGWADGVGVVGGVSERASCEDPALPWSAVALVLSPLVPGEFITLAQRCPARSLAGYQLTLSGMLQLAPHDAESWAGLWVRVDSPDGEPLLFQNMHDRAVRSGPPEERTLQITIPAKAEWLNFGALLVGGGVLQVGPLTLRVTRPDGETLAPIDLLALREEMEKT